MNPLMLLWGIFWVATLVVCALDLLVVSRNEGVVNVQSALRWTGLWVAVALAFGGAIYGLHPQGSTLAAEYVAGYLTEYSLSVDNLFVFILIFSMMGVHPQAQPKLIKLGIYLSIVLRVLFILFGIALVNRFHWVLYAFGAVLIWTAWKMLTAEGSDQVKPEKNIFHRLASQWLPLRSEGPESRRLVIRHEGRWYITPLFLVFLVIGSTDVLFAIDSIPAIMGISQNPFVVLTSNVFAVLGLNSLFFALRGVMGMFQFLQHGVSLILFFIGAKMLAGIHPPVERWFKEHTFVSLLVIGTILVVSIVLSLWHGRAMAHRDAGTHPPADPGS